MHVVATNVCVWIRTLVLESIKEIAQYHRNQGRVEAGILGKRLCKCDWQLEFFT